METDLTKAKETILRLLARRDHSKLELKNKLKLRNFSAASIEAALAWAEQRAYLRPQHELAEVVARQVLLKKKGSQYLKNELQRRGIKVASTDGLINEEQELKQIHSLLKDWQNKNSGNTELSSNSKLFIQEKAKWMRRLLSRGFKQSLILKALQNT